MPRQQKWDNVSLPTGTYRLKPEEPEYEYLWYKENGTTQWGTINEWESFGPEKWFQATETKRIRKGKPC